MASKKETINFFSDFFRASQANARVTLYAMFAAIFIIMLVASYYIFLQIKISDLNTQISNANLSLTDKHLVQQVTEYNKVSQYNTVLEKYNIALTKTHENVKAGQVAGTAMLGKVVNALPQGAKVTNLTMNLERLSINFSSGSVSDGASYVQSLKLLNLFETVSMVSMMEDTKNAGTIIFAVECTMKGGAAQ